VDRRCRVGRLLPTRAASRGAQRLCRSPPETRSRAHHRLELRAASSREAGARGSERTVAHAIRHRRARTTRSSTTFAACEPQPRSAAWASRRGTRLAQLLQPMIHKSFHVLRIHELRHCGETGYVDQQHSGPTPFLPSCWRAGRRSGCRVLQRVSALPAESVVPSVLVRARFWTGPRTAGAALKARRQRAIESWLLTRPPAISVSRLHRDEGVPGYAILKRVKKDHARKFPSALL